MEYLSFPAAANATQRLVEARGIAASREMTASEGSTSAVNVVGAPSTAEPIMAAAHRMPFPRMYFRFMASSSGIGTEGRNNADQCRLPYPLLHRLESAALPKLTITRSQSQSDPLTPRFNAA
jgi:hypothetical protein